MSLHISFFSSTKSGLDWFRIKYEGWNVGITGIPSHSSHFPRIFEISGFPPKKAATAEPPRATIVFGRTARS